MLFCSIYSTGSIFFAYFIPISFGPFILIIREDTRYFKELEVAFYKAFIKLSDVKFFVAPLLRMTSTYTKDRPVS